MSSHAQQAQTLVEALPYIQKFTGKTIVVKYGGNAMISDELRKAVMSDIILLNLVGIRVVMVHGGGPEISATMKEMGLTPRFIDGLRYTDADTMRVVQMVLCGKTNKDLVKLINMRGGKAMGLSGLDGVLLAGGNDVSPDLYGHEPINALGEVNPLRDDFEGRLVRMAAQMNMPVLGICRGIQSMNVALGGILWQDVPSQYHRPDGEEGLAHSQTRADFYTSHRVKIEKGTLLERVIGEEEIWVNTFHHQAVREAAPGLAVGAHASDGLIESIEHPGLPFFLGVQWHPERYFDRDRTAMALFDAFADAARAYAAKK